MNGSLNLSAVPINKRAAAMVKSSPSTDISAGELRIGGQLFLALLGNLTAVCGNYCRHHSVGESGSGHYEPDSRATSAYAKKEATPLRQDQGLAANRWQPHFFHLHHLV